MERLKLSLLSEMTSRRKKGHRSTHQRLMN
nr:MAG TPA: hypothetical protein [Caudoviricetes sp.]